MAERLLAKGEKGQHQCCRCLELFDFVGNGQWIPTTCPKCQDKNNQTIKDLELIEYGLRIVIGQFFDYACTAEREGRSPEVISRKYQAYEEAVETYRRVTGKDPVAK